MSRGSDDDVWATGQVSPRISAQRKKITHEPMHLPHGSIADQGVVHPQQLPHIHLIETQTGDQARRYRKTDPEGIAL
tara:strand:+ start:609 stop:839 length:231 start_codon:yes stop_codon:yes gene_type:complete